MKFSFCVLLVSVAVPLVTSSDSSSSKNGPLNKLLRRSYERELRNLRAARPDSDLPAPSRKERDIQEILNELLPDEESNSGEVASVHRLRLGDEVKDLRAPKTEKKLKSGRQDDADSIDSLGNEMKIREFVKGRRFQRLRLGDEVHELQMQNAAKEFKSGRQDDSEKESKIEEVLNELMPDEDADDLDEKEMKIQEVAKRRRFRHRMRIGEEVFMRQRNPGKEPVTTKGPVPTLIIDWQDENGCQRVIEKAKRRQREDEENHRRLGIEYSPPRQADKAQVGGECNKREAPNVNEHSSYRKYVPECRSGSFCYYCKCVDAPWLGMQ